MGVRKWTDNQSDAINAPVQTLLVSAAAGSGKTAVLTERIITRITDPIDPADISEIIAVTFMKDAAGELKERLSARLEEMLSADPTNRRLSDQILKLQNAEISTVHSLCNNIIKEHASEIGVPFDFRILDETEADTLALQAARNTVDAWYDGKVPSDCDKAEFRKLCDIISKPKQPNRLEELLVSYYKKMRNVPYPVENALLNNERMTRECLKAQSGELDFFNTTIGSIVHDDTKEKLRLISSYYFQAGELAVDDSEAFEKLHQFISDEHDYFTYILKTFDDKTYEEIFELINNFRFDSLPRTSNECKVKANIKELRDEAKKIKQALYEDYFCLTVFDLGENVKNTLKLQKVFLTMLGDFEKQYTKLKIDKSGLDFSDLEHYAVKILCKNTTDFTNIEKTKTAKELSKRYKELFIDEYQDTNLLQDTIFRAISNGSNRFMVGDPKQCIYRFRGATPEIFSEYKNRFDKYENGTESRESKIYLSNNFRSSESIIDFTNRVFEVVLNSNPKNRIYLEDDRLVFSKEKKASPSVEIDIFMPNGKPEFEMSEDEDDEFIPEDGEIADNSLCEAYGIAEKITDLISSGSLKEDGTKIGYSDIAVLSRKTNILGKVRKVLEQYHIPCTDTADSEFLYSPEILFMTSLLCAVDNPVRDVYLIGAMLSPIYGFTKKELYRIRGFSKDTSYVNAVRECAKQSGELSAKCGYFLARLNEYRELSRTIYIDRLIDRIYITDSIKEIFSVTGIENLDAPDAVNVREHLNRFYELARSYRGFSDGGLSGFLSYIENVKRDGENVTSEPAGNRVSLITVHKSKGLEFPVVFMCGLGSRFNKDDLRGDCIYEPQLGFCTNNITDDREVIVPSLLRKCAERKLTSELIEEEKRILYVGFTRARERLCISAKVPFLKSFLQKTALSHGECISTGTQYICVNNSDSEVQMLLSALSDSPTVVNTLNRYLGLPEYEENSPEDFVIRFTDADRFSTLKADKAERKNVSEVQAGFSREDYEKVADLINYEYEKESVSNLPKKVAVSSVDSIGKEEPLALRSLSDLGASLTGASADYAFIGTAMHSFMEFCNFDLCERDGSRRVAELLLFEEFISKEQFDVLDFEKLDRFFESDLYRKLCESKTVQREFQFDILVAANELIDTDETEKILLQGTIDCFFENPDGSLTVFDFKTDRTHDQSELIKRHSKQLGLYKKALVELTGKSVKDAYIYSFELGREIKI